MRAAHPKTLIQPGEICTCSMLTVALLLLYRKLIPLRFLPWCNNLITLGCRRILIFLCFSKVKNRQVARAFRVPSRQPWTKLSEIRRACCQNFRWQNRVCEFWLFFSLIKSCLPSTWQFWNCYVPWNIICYILFARNMFPLGRVIIYCFGFLPLC